jgi:hypothetical protein
MGVVCPAAFQVRMIVRNVFLFASLIVSCHGSAKAEDVWTTVNDDDPAAVYGPGIQGGGFDGYFHKDLHAGNQPGQWVKVSFEGTGVKWIGAKNRDHGDAEIYIDGVLDTTVSSKDPQWLKQQEIYTKTGLPLGPHTMKIVVKNGTSDFDAFAFLAPKPRAAVMPSIEGVTLPPLQPLLNTPSRYVLGNGVAMVLCEPDGEIDSAFGPGYTTSDLVKHEDVLIDLDSVEAPLRVNMQRAAGTGIYYGVAARGDLDIGVVDYAAQGEPSILRLILLKNRSGSASHTIIVRDNITPYTDPGYKSWLAIDPAGKCSAFALQADTTQGVPYGGNNPVDKSVVIAFDDPASLTAAAGDSALLQTKPLTLAPGAQHEVALTHLFRATDALPDVKAIAALRAVDPHATLKKSIEEWTNWTSHVPPAYALSKIADERARVFVEGALVLLKTNQSQDGGAIANSPHYKEGYVRDAAMSMRGLLATGHAEEAKRWLVWIDKELATHHNLGDAMSCGVSLNDPSYSLGDGTEVEEPGWVLLVARDYLKLTHDLAFLKSIDATLRFCADSQLKNEAAHDSSMDFNGDETEICDNLNIQATGFHRGEPWWSLSSVAMAAASINFYIEYVKATGGDPANYHNALANETTNLDAEVKKLVSAMDRDFWRTDAADIPGGFHEFARHKDDNAWPKAHIVNFTLMPVFFGTPYSPEERSKDVAATAQFFDPKTGFLQLIPGANIGMDGHDLGYLLWDCVEINDPHKDQVYHALLTGPTVDAWGSFYEIYGNEGQPGGGDRGLRSLETGANVTALVKYLHLGESN